MTDLNKLCFENFLADSQLNIGLDRLGTRIERDEKFFISTFYFKSEYRLVRND